MQAGRDVLLTSGIDMTLEGTQVSAGRHILLDAANDLNIQSALSSFSENSSSKESSASIGMSVGVGFQGVTVSGNIGASFQKSKSSASGTNHKLARLSADQITLKSGNDTKVKGAKVKGRKVTTDVGGDLTVESVQNTYQSKSNSSGGGLNLGIGLGGSSTLGQEVAKIPEQVSKNIANNGKGQSKTVGVSANFSKGTAERAWVDELTEITATEELNINVKGNTHLKGAVIAAVSGNLNLKTGTFTYEDIIDYDRSKNIGGSLNLSHSFGGPKSESQADKANQTMAGVSDAFKRSSFGVDGSYEKKDKEGITRATVGAGTLNVQDKTKQAELENTGKTQKLANINRDLNATQEVTKDERSYIGVYVTDTSVREAFEAGKTVAEALEAVGQALVGGGILSSKQVEGGLEVYKKVLELGVSPEELKACVGRQGSLWDWLITPAHAGDICGVITRYFSKEDIKTCLELWDRMKSGAGRYAADGMEAFIKAYEEDPKSFNAIFKAMDLPGEIARMIAFTPEERVKFEAMVASDTRKAIAMLQPYLDGLLTKVQNGEVDPEEAALIATTAFVFIAKLAPKKLRGLLVRKTKDSFKKISQAVKLKKTQNIARNIPNKPVSLGSNLVGDGDPLKGALNWIRPKPNQYDVVVHGSADGFHVLHNGKYVELNHRSLANYMKANGYDGKTPIRLLSCSTGCPGGTVAQNLANKLGVPVQAPSNTLWVHPSGKLTIGPNAGANTGQWNIFTPGN